MSETVFEKVVGIIHPYAKNQAALSSIAMETSLLGDLQVNSARLVDVVLEMEDAFGVAIADEDADAVRTVGDAVRLIERLTA